MSLFKNKKKSFLLGAVWELGGCIYYTGKINEKHVHNHGLKDIAMDGCFNKLVKTKR